MELYATSPLPGRLAFAVGSPIYLLRGIIAITPIPD